MDINERIDLLRNLIGQRDAIDIQLVEALGDQAPTCWRCKKAQRDSDPKAPTTEKTAQRGRPRKIAPTQKKKSGFTDAERTNIIELYRRGELTGSIAKLMNVPPTKMYVYIYQSKKDGTITKADQLQRDSNKPEPLG